MRHEEANPSTQHGTCVQNDIALERKRRHVSVRVDRFRLRACGHAHPEHHVVTFAGPEMFDATVFPLARF
jgi:hypothetical protein